MVAVKEEIVPVEFGTMSMSKAKNDPKSATGKVGVKVEIKIETKPTRKVKKGSRSDKTSGGWDKRYNECKEFLKKNNHCKIPTNFKENKSLGIWVQETRRNFMLMMKGKKPRRELTQEVIVKLNELGFYWGIAPDPNKFPETDVSWEKNFAQLQEYEKTHGNSEVPMDGSDNVALSKLCKWTRVQRTQKNYHDTKRKCFITKDRIKKLNGIGFDWKGPRKMNSD
mmetsp:Transcript_26868/g.57591  ORF Transcript_26868/g.57591 Transcript_26868/m.57591 type:complete len:224 (-) Transcript_26868:366-1037(-)|eukprot:CAMPEP_0201129924 /NCGR_PEP_ID=MMETSP0850-20130426/38336_1 /ASSEMBLY_ACC=CAM_ASM_000622 /TAXON_ID=183588 /ORGANISM="Pseudo-nitzschia fraudulenta, Strain WWA7" /LENGTH=223 /DNA_ID=CAMNT_0047399529 /DNA_START=257 /DNA_END=928 /DNA_ORIENTATION=-